MEEKNPQKTHTKKNPKQNYIRSENAGSPPGNYCKDICVPLDGGAVVVSLVPLHSRRLRAGDESPHYHSVYSHRHNCQSFIVKRALAHIHAFSDLTLPAAAAAAVNLIITCDSACDSDVPLTPSHLNTGITLMLKILLTSLL